MPIGVIVNCISVLAGGVIGSALGHVLPNSLKEHLPTLFGMCSIAIGINSIIKAVSMTAVVLAILVGFTIGHLLRGRCCLPEGGSFSLRCNIPLRGKRSASR